MDITYEGNENATGLENEYHLAITVDSLILESNDYEKIKILLVFDEYIYKMGYEIQNICDEPRGDCEEHIEEPKVADDVLKSLLTSRPELENFLHEHIRILIEQKKKEEELANNMVPVSLADNIIKMLLSEVTHEDDKDENIESLIDDTIKFVISSIPEFKKITQEVPDCMDSKPEDAIAALESKPVKPRKLVSETKTLMIHSISDLFAERLNNTPIICMILKGTQKMGTLVLDMSNCFTRSIKCNDFESARITKACEFEADNGDKGKILFNIMVTMDAPSTKRFRPFYTQYTSEKGKLIELFVADKGIKDNKCQK